MKAVICTHDLALHIHTPGTGRWAVCQCGHTGARWEDPRAGRLIVACRSNRGSVRVLGLNNQYLLPAVTTVGRVTTRRSVSRVQSTSTCPARACRARSRTSRR